MTPQQRRDLAARWAARGIGVDPVHARRDVDVDEYVDWLYEQGLPREERSVQ